VFVLKDLLDHETLGLSLVTDPTRAEQRRVVGAHSIEVQGPSRWVPEDWVMLTAGLRLRDQPDQQEVLVEELAKGNVAALGLAVDVFFDEVPPGMVARADELGLPIFTVPLPTPFREVISFVNGSLLSTELQVLRRSFSMQRFLMDALAEPNPRQILVDRLAGILQSSVAIISPSGEMISSSNRAPLPAIWAEIKRHPTARRRFKIGTWSATASQVEGSDEWLVVATQHEIVSRQIAGPMIDATQRLLALVRVASRAAAVEARALRSELLNDLLERSGGTTTQLEARLGAHGLGGKDGLRVVVMRAIGEASSTEIRDALELAARSDCVPMLATERTHEVVALLATLKDPKELLRGWLMQMSEDGLTVAAGVGRQMKDSQTAVESLRDARLALSSRQGAEKPDVFSFDDLDVARMLIGEVGSLRVLGKVNDFIEPLREHPDLFETLQTYFEERCNVSQAAIRLHLHANSLRYRLSRIEELLEIDLHDPADVSNVYLALTAAALQAE
jgi:DNA-binding PucR family transcriptional regulator